jgi:hypothetical protein
MPQTLFSANGVDGPAVWVPDGLSGVRITSAVLRERLAELAAFLVRPVTS